LLDSSGSETRQNFAKQLTFVASLVNAYNIDTTNGVRVSLIVFSSTTHIQFDLKTYHSKASVLQAIAKTPYFSGASNTAAALSTTLSHTFTTSAGDRPDVPDILFVITDGKSASAVQTSHAAQAIHRAHIKTYAIGVGTSVHHSELDRIASDSQYVFTVSSFDKLHTLQSELISASCGSKLTF
jgi:hypothetical protein